MRAISVVGFGLTRTGLNVSICLRDIEIRVFILLTTCTGQIRSTVTDGITIGRPCCGRHNCPLPLPHVKKKFCFLHSNLASQCAVEDCTAVVGNGHLTCEDPEHREIETRYHERGKGMFQLKQRLERAKLGQTHDSLPSQRSRLRDDREDDMDEEIGEGAGLQVDDDDAFMDKDGACDDKPETGNRAPRARFGRRRTHNEELCVGSCGVILGRATFFGSEAPNGVRVSINLCTPCSL